MRVFAICQDELVIRCLDDVLVPSFEVDFLVESRPLATNQGEIRRGYACLFTLMFDRSRMTDLDADRLLRLTLELLLELPKHAHR